MKCQLDHIQKPPLDHQWKNPWLLFRRFQRIIGTQQPEQPGWRARLRQAENFQSRCFFFESWHWWSFGDSWICWVFKFWVVLCPMLFERLSMFVLSLLFLCFEASMLCSEFLPGQHHAPQKSLDSHGKWPFVMFDKFKKKLHKKKHANFPYGYGSIPINTIFNGMNIHKSQLFWCELQGYKVLTHPHILDYQRLINKITICYHKKWPHFRRPPGSLWAPRDTSGGCLFFAC